MYIGILLNVPYKSDNEGASKACGLYIMGRFGHLKVPSVFNFKIR